MTNCRRARTIAPDLARLKRNGPEPVPHGDSEDVELFNLLWQKTATGVSPVECESICPADSYRVRTLLARWIEEGALVVE